MSCYCSGRKRARWKKVPLRRRDWKRTLEPPAHKHTKSRYEVFSAVVMSSIILSVFSRTASTKAWQGKSGEGYLYVMPRDELTTAPSRSSLKHAAALSALPP